MEPPPITPTAESRRIFITENQVDFFQLFSFTQNKKDGSIYVSWPSIDSAKWLLVDDYANPTALHFNDSPGKGKISFHGSGQVHYKIHPDANTRHFNVNGNILQRQLEERIGARHLLTTMITKPEAQSDNSPAFNRKTDYSFKADKIQPAIFILFAIPQKGLQLSLNFSLRTEDMDNIPDDIFGFGTIPMHAHDILWIAYRTKHLNHFPKHSHAMYTDGFLVPLFIGKEQNRITVEIVKPTYTLTENTLEIKLGSTTD